MGAEPGHTDYGVLFADVRDKEPFGGCVTKIGDSEFGSMGNFSRVEGSIRIGRVEWKLEWRSGDGVIRNK